MSGMQFIVVILDWNFYHRKFKILAPLAIVGTQLRAPLEPLSAILQECKRGFRVGALIGSP